MIPKEDRRPWEELRALLERDDMTQRQLAEESGYSPQYINDIIRGRVLPTTRVRRKFTEVLRFPVDELLPDNMLSDDFVNMTREFQRLPDREDRSINSK